MMVLFWLWSWTYLLLLPSILLIYWLLLSLLLLLVWWSLYIVWNLNTVGAADGKKKKKDIFSDAAGRQRKGQRYPANLQAGCSLSQVPRALSIPRGTPSTGHYLSTTAFAPQLWVMSPKGGGKEPQTEPREDLRMLYCRSVRKGVVIV